MAVGCLVTALLLITVSMVMGDINLALNRPSSQSSISSYGYCRKRSCGASQANDGNIRTTSVADSKKSTEWWSVDLGDLAKLNKIHLYLSHYAWRKGYYSHLVVYTAKQNPGTWRVCKNFTNTIKKQKELKGKYFVVVCSRATVARYVKVALLRNKPLYLTEVMVYGTYVKDINFALDRPSSQSSISPYGYCQKRSCGASQANDGNIGTTSVADSKKSTEWWSVDLGDLIKIKNIRLYFSQYAWKKGYYSHVVVYTAKQNPGRWSVCRKFINTLKKPKELKGKYFVVMCSRATVARYVKVVLLHKPLYLAEVKVYGTFAGDHPN